MQAAAHCARRSPRRRITKEMSSSGSETSEISDIRGQVTQLEELTCSRGKVADPFAKYKIRKRKKARLLLCYISRPMPASLITLQIGVGAPSVLRRPPDRDAFTHGPRHAKGAHPKDFCTKGPSPTSYLHLGAPRRTMDAGELMSSLSSQLAGEDGLLARCDHLKDERASALLTLIRHGVY